MASLQHDFDIDAALIESIKVRHSNTERPITGPEMALWITQLFADNDYLLQRVAQLEAERKELQQVTLDELV